MPALWIGFLISFLFFATAPPSHAGDMGTPVPPAKRSPRRFDRLDTLRGPLPLSVPLPVPAESLSPVNPIPVAARIAGNDNGAGNPRASGVADAAADLVTVLVILYSPDRFGASPPDRASLEDPARLGWIAAAGRRFVDRNRRFGFVPRRGLSHLPIVIGRLPAHRIAEVAADPLVRSIGRVHTVWAMRAEGGALMGANTLAAAGGDGVGIGVAILDTGIDDSHSELEGQVRAIFNYTGDPDEDLVGHGTSCAGIVAGKLAGMAPRAHLWNMKVLGDDGIGDTGGIVEAFNDILANLGLLGGVHLVSASLGGEAPQGQCDPFEPALAFAMRALNDAGIAIFFAAGNDGCAIGVSSPACISHAIAVGAVYDSGLGSRSYGSLCGPNGICVDAETAADRITCYSNSGDALDLLAPADCATTTRAASQGGGLRECFNGTSAATPYAAGVAAQLLSLVPGATPARLRDALAQTGVPITDGRNQITRRRIDAPAALARLAGGGEKNNIYFLAAAARRQGLAYFQTDLRVFNTATVAASVDAYFLPAADNSAAVPVAFSVGPRASAAFPDVVGTLMGLSDAAGGIRFASDQPLRISSNTYAVTAAGTYGQFIPGVAPAAAGTRQTVLHLIGDANCRTNFGLLNTTTANATATIVLRNGEGAVLGQVSATLGPYGWTQYDRILDLVGAPAVGNAYAEVVANVPILAYASTIDNRTDDPIFIPGERE